MNMKLGGSVALKRPLAFDSPAEDDSYRMLVYGNMPKKARDWDGVTTEFGLRSQLNIGRVNILGWGYIGQLYDDYDWRLLYDQFTYYRYAQGQVLPKDANRDHYWSGVRTELAMFGFFTRISLFLAGALVLSLSFGLMLLPDDTAAVERGVEIIVVGLALMTVKHNVGAVDNLIGLAFSKDEEEEV